MYIMHKKRERKTDTEMDVGHILTLEKEVIYHVENHIGTIRIKPVAFDLL